MHLADLCLSFVVDCGKSRQNQWKGDQMDYSRMGGVKPTYGKNKPRNENNRRNNDKGTDKAALLERMKKAAAEGKAPEKEHKG
jgi:hypothetical protein